MHKTSKMVGGMAGLGCEACDLPLHLAGGGPVSRCKPDQFATGHRPDSGEKLLVCYTAEKFVKAACEKVDVTTSHVTHGPFLDVLMECKRGIEIILNPATDAMIAISASLANATRDIASDIRKK